ncbi:ABC transporter ATP-binding protein [Chishuiella sp.]|uniref:ABC transporter ATP-binding protein n=1 Tax=Chishuiella sp. TaxID=1969467 RepID=UPI0028A79229|nr:ABC transporter ATP-binding protein [Chishuiella sp.]
MIQINNISKQYGVTKVIHIDHLKISKGESVGLVGNNGAGKTTLFSLMLDLIPPTTGNITLNDIQVNRSEDWKKFTTAFLDESFLINYLTPEEYFYFIGDLRGQNRASIDQFITQYSDFFNGEILGKKKYLRDFSKGNQKKVGIIATLIGDPKIIILDEPFANLDPSTQIRLKNLIKDLTLNREKTILISSHDINHTVEISTRIIALNKGELVKDIETSTQTLEELESFFTV